MSEDVTDLTRGVYRRVYSGFITGQRINRISQNAEAWFWRVLVTVDDFGNGPADPEMCKTATAGRRKVTTKQISGWLREMKQAGLITFYTAKGEPFLHVVGFEDSQPAGKNGKRIKKFPFPDESRCIQVNPELSSASDNHTDNHTDNEHKPHGKAALVSQVFEFWKSEMKHPKAQLTPDRKKKIEERLDDSTVEEIETAIRGCKASDFHMGREPGRPEVFDDIELICRKRSKLEFFIAKAPAPAKPPKIETVRDRLKREGCERCFGTGTETIPGKGAKVCDHSTTSNIGSSTAVESPSENREARIS